MNEYSDDFKGVRFPKDLWLDKSISLIEKGILVVIKNLDKSDDHCWATNNYLADFFQCNPRTIIRAIWHLKELWYIEEAKWGKTGVCRKLRINIDINNPWQNVTPDKMSPVTKCHTGGDKMSGVPVTKCHPNNIVYNNINNNIRQTENFSNASASPSSGWDVDTVLDDWAAKKKRKTKKQQRYDEVLSSAEFTTAVLAGITNEVEQEEIKTLWSEFVEMRCSKDYRAFTDGAVKRNLKVLEWTTFPERKAILDKSVTKWWTGLFPLNDYDKQRLEKTNSSIEWSDERIIKKVFETNCMEREDELPNWTTHTLLMDLCEKYWEWRIKGIYYDKVKPQVDARYSIKRDWKN